MCMKPGGRVGVKRMNWNYSLGCALKRFMERFGVERGKLIMSATVVGLNCTWAIILRS